jgi:hypothetical protein
MLATASIPATWVTSGVIDQKGVRVYRSQSARLAQNGRLPTTV